MDAVERVVRGTAAYPRALDLLGSDAPPWLEIIGSASILRRPLLALFGSARITGTGLLPAYDLARSLRDAEVPVAGGFHSPLERECLDLLLRGNAPLAAFPARGVGGMRVPAPWRAALDGGRLVVATRCEARCRRPTTALAEARNRMVAALAAAIVVVHAAPGGRLARLVASAARWGKPVYCLDLPENHDLRLLGAVPVDPGDGGWIWRRINERGASAPGGEGAAARA